MELKELKRLHDAAYNSSQVTRERASDDLVFYWVTQWDDNVLAESQLAYRGEFNILRKAGRDIISSLAANPVQVDFYPISETSDDAGEMVDGLYRSDDSRNSTLDAYANGSTESVVCGVGCWLLHTEYESNRVGDVKQVIRRKPVYEANNTVFWDPNAKLLDKSDADYVSILTAYSEDGYKKLVNELTGEELEHVNANSFKQPEQSYTFPWIGGESKKIYVTKFFHRKKVKRKILNMVDPMGSSLILDESSLLDAIDDMLDGGYTVESERMVERWEVTQYIASGASILSSDIVAGENIPAVPVYGERAYIEGEEHWEGVTRLAKDPQRLRNFQLSYLADIVSRSPRTKPIFLPEQVQSFEHMYEESGADNNFPYLLQNRVDGAGQPLPIGPVGIMPEQPIPQALIASIDLSRQAVEDVANPGLPQNIADPDLSGKAVVALQNRMDKQSQIYQDHMKHAKRRDGEIYASMAAEVYDVPRKVVITMPDGTRKSAEIMETVIDSESGEIVTLNDLNSSEFEVTSKIGPSYDSQKEQTIERLSEMVSLMDPADPMRKALLLKILRLMDGVEFDDLRDYANKQLVLTGIREPETEEEQELLQQVQSQGQEPGADMVLAQAEMLKGQAAQMREERENIKMQLNAQNEQSKNQIDVFEAQTDRMTAQVNAQKAGADINETNIEAFGKQLDNKVKITELRKPEAMSTEELYAQILGN
jgi:hypothetical protein